MKSKIYTRVCSQPEKIDKPKNLMAFILLFTSLTHFGQVGLSNLSFETWTTSVYGPAPVGWIGFNISQETVGSQHGSKFLRLNNANSSQGVAILGSAAPFSSTIKGGVSYTQTPPGLSGFYKTSGMMAGDVVGIAAYTSKTGTMCAMATFTANTNTATWTSFSEPFISFNAGPVDSLFMFATSGTPFGPNTNSPGLLFD